MIEPARRYPPPHCNYSAPEAIGSGGDVPPGPRRNERDVGGCRQRPEPGIRRDGLLGRPFLAPEFLCRNRHPGIELLNEGEPFMLWHSPDDPIAIVVDGPAGQKR